MRRLLFPALLVLTGCTPVKPSVCPVLMSYTRADDLALLNEKNALDASKTPFIRRYLRDYSGLRAQVRECEKRKT